MKKDLIRIFINNKDYVKISPFSSLYALKQTIKETFYKNISYDSIILYYNDKPLLKDSYSLVQYNITDNTHIFTRIKTIGGNSDFFEKLMIVLFCIFIVLCYFGILAFGLLPIMASIFGLIINKGVNFFINKFKIKEDIGKTKYIFKFIFWIFKTFIIIFFIWGLTAIVSFPLYSLIGYSKCESGIKSKRVGKVTMIWFIVFYFMFNIVDFIFSFTGSVVNQKTAIGSVVSPAIEAIKKTNDKVKFFIFYFIPFFGQILLGYHMFLNNYIYFLYSSLGYVSSRVENNGTLKKGEIISLYKHIQAILKNKKLSFNESTAKVYIKDNKITEIVNRIHVSIFDKIPNEEKKELEPPSDYEKYEKDKKINNFFKNIFFSILEIIKVLDKLINNIGTPSDVLNMLKTSQIVGIICIPVFIITCILQLL